MRIIGSLESFGPARCALAMGKFDGVHLGHQMVLARAVQIARERGVESVALTFDRNPLALVDPGRAPRSITPLGRKRALIERMGIDCLIVRQFTRALMDMEPEDFLRELARSLRPVAIVCGENFTFGRAARGGARTLAEFAGQMGYEAVVVPLCEVDGEPASSTRVRDLIERGEMDAAERVLGRKYTQTTVGEE